MSAASRPTTLAMLATVLATPLASAAGVLPPGDYEITTETFMPHLEENLRYSITRHRRCLVHQDSSAAFPILGHAALKGCRLVAAGGESAGMAQVLVCATGSQTTGNALWQFGAQQIIGTLHVKLGGKNMTFQQRVTARRLGHCAVRSNDEK